MILGNIDKSSYFGIVFLTKMYFYMKNMKTLEIFCLHGLNKVVVCCIDNCLSLATLGSVQRGVLKRYITDTRKDIHMTLQGNMIKISLSESDREDFYQDPEGFLRLIGVPIKPKAFQELRDLLYGVRKYVLVGLGLFSKGKIIN